MKEISFFKYIINKNLKIGEVKLNNKIDNKLLFTELKNVFLYPGLWSVISNDYFIFNDFERYLSKYKHDKEIVNRQNEIKKNLQLISQIKGTYYLFGAEENYWHFLIDFIPRLVCLKYLSHKRIKVIVSDRLPEKFFHFISKVSTLLNIPEIDFLKINQNNLVYSFEKLIFSSRPSISYASNFLNQIYKNHIVKKKKKNLYVKRGNTIRRKVLNEEQIIEFIRQYDYDIVDCFDLEIEEQIKVFSEAKNIIIPSGASMANLIFTPDNINVVEIRSNLDGDFSEKINLKKRFKLYSFNKTIKIGEELRKNIIVDIDELKKLIEEKNIF